MIRKSTSKKMMIRYLPKSRIRKISGELFYELVTGRPNALRELYEAIPLALDAIIAEKGLLSSNDLTAMDDLKEVSESKTETSYLKYFFDHAFRNSQIK
jgi:hypothetical protein